MYLRIDEINVARRMGASLGFSFDYYSLFNEKPYPSAFFPPLYVFNVYALYSIFHSELAIPIQNILLSLGVAMLLFVLARRLFGEVPARICLVLSVLYPPMFVRITHGSPVYFKMFFMVLLVLILHRVWTGKTTLAPIAGCVAGLLALAMPDALVFVLFFVVALMLRNRDWKAVRISMMIACGLGLTIAPWTIANWVRFRELCLISNNGGFNFYMGNNPFTSHEVDYSQISRLDQALGGELARANEFERDHVLFKEGLTYMASNPWQSLKNVGSRALLHWGLRPENREALTSFGGDATTPTDFNQVRGRATSGIGVYAAYVWTYLISYTLVAALGAFGCVLSRPYWSRLGPIWISFAYSTAIAAFFIVQTKMRLIKVEPFLLILAAFALAWFLCPGERNRVLVRADTSTRR